MSTNKQTGKTVGKVIAYILVLLVVAGVIAVIVRFTGGFTSDFKTFYVSVDGKDILTSAGGYEITNEKPLTVDVKYTFGSAGGDVSGYSVKVVPHAVEGKDFDFTLDDQVYSFQAETDLTAGFDIAREETSFTITPKGGVTERCTRTTRSAIAATRATRICTRSSSRRITAKRVLRSTSPCYRKWRE